MELNGFWGDVVERLKVIGKDAVRRSEFVLFHMLFFFNAMTHWRSLAKNEEMRQCTCTSQWT